MERVLAELKAGRLLPSAGGLLAADPARGLLRVVAAPDGLTRLLWLPRAAGGGPGGEAAVDVIIFPQEARLVRLSQPATCFQLKFASEPERNLCFWGQEPAGVDCDAKLGAFNDALRWAEPAPAAAAPPPAAAEAPAAGAAAAGAAAAAAAAAAAPPPPAPPAAGDAGADATAATVRRIMADLAARGLRVGASAAAAGAGAPSPPAARPAPPPPPPPASPHQPLAARLAAQLASFFGAGAPAAAPAAAARACPPLESLVTVRLLSEALQWPGAAERLAPYLPPGHAVGARRLGRLAGSPALRAQLRSLGAALERGDVAPQHWGLRRGAAAAGGGWGVLGLLEAVQAEAEAEAEAAEAAGAGAGGANAMEP